MAEFSFNAITVEETELPEITRASGRPAKTENNPFKPWVLESWTQSNRGEIASKGGRAITIPKAQLKDALYLIRKAAEDLELGIRVVVTLPNSMDKLSKEDIEALNDRKNVKVRFRAQKKRAYSPRTRRSAAATAATPAASTGGATHSAPAAATASASAPAASAGTAGTAASA